MTAAQVEAAGATRFRLGPIDLEGQGWPEAWWSYARKAWPAAEGAPQDVVTLKLGHLGPNAHKATRLTEAMTVGREGEGWRIRVDDLVSAFYDPSSSSVTVDLDELLEIARVSLGNVARGLVSLLLPLRYQGLMLHASSGVKEGQGAVFAGVSTAGKTTLALGFEEVKFLSDDISLIRMPAEGRPQLLPSPFFGAAGKRGHDEGGELIAVCLLEKGAQTRVERVSGAEAVTSLMRHAVCFSHEAPVEQAVLDMVARVAATVPVVRIFRSLDTPSDEVFARVRKEVGG